MLHLEGRNPAKFRFSDGLSETIVVLQPDDDSEMLAAKLQRVLELEGIAPPAAPPAPAFDLSHLPPRRPEPAEFDPLIDVAAAEAAVMTRPVGWEEYDVEDLPEA